MILLYYQNILMLTILHSCASIKTFAAAAGGRPLPRQIREAQKIANETPGRLINGRNEHIPPAIRPLAPGHLLDNEAVRGDERRGAGR